MGVFTDTIYKFCPPWFLGPEMGKLLAGFAGTLDDMAERSFEGRRAAIPYAGGSKTDDGVLRECDEEVLDWHARDRGIRLYSTEPLLSKRVRLSRWRQLKKRRGSHLGELTNLQPFWLATPASVLPTMRIVHQDRSGTPTSTWHTIDPLGAYSVVKSVPSNWNYDGQADKRTRFWLIVHLPPGYSTGIVYDGPNRWDDGSIYDGVTALAIRDLIDGVGESKAAHSLLGGIIATTLQPTDVIPGVAGTHYPFDPSDTAQTSAEGWTTLPIGNWGSMIDPDTGLPTRPPWASWLYDPST